LVIRPLADGRGALALDQGVKVDDGDVADVADVLGIVATADGKALAGRLLQPPDVEETVVSVTALGPRRCRRRGARGLAGRRHGPRQRQRRQ
jgi:hypothetical protein